MWISGALPEHLARAQQKFHDYLYLGLIWTDQPCGTIVYTYSDKSFLIIDDFGEFRRSVKTMCQQLGAVDIDQAATGQEAVNQCLNKKYDIILSDYNLGDGKDGQQILEELIHRRLLKPSAIFVMVTAENSTAMVMGALEYQPDAYLTKPFNKVALKTRLDKLMEKKQAMQAINNALEAGKHSLVLKLCDQEVAANSRYALSALRIKAELLEERGELTAAYTLYSTLCKERPLSWAIAGAARILIKQGNPRAARGLLESATKELPTFLDAQDLLADAMLQLGDSQNAQNVLQEAVKRSPKAVLRQRKLGEIALKNEDYPVATRAFKQTVSQGRHSVFKQSDPYLKLAHCLTRSLGGSPVEDKRTSDEFHRVLNELETDYKGDQEIAMRSLLAQAELHKTQNRTDDAASAAKGAAKLLAGLDRALPPDTAIDVAEKFVALGDADSAKQVLDACALLHGDDENLKKQRQEILGKAVKTDDANDRAVELNNAGAKFFEKGDHENALRNFRKAIELAPQNISIVLNMAQTLLDIFQANPAEKDLPNECLRCLERIQHISPEDKRYARFQALLRQTQQIKAEHGA